MIGFGSNSSIVPTESNELSYKKAHSILASQRLSSVLKLKNGEQITYAEVGDRNGIPCFWIGGPCSNRMIIALYNDMCVEMGIRLISFDRPGRGGSSPLQNPKEWNFAKYAHYLDQVSDLLNIEKFYIVAHSFGSSYAYAVYEKLKLKIIGSVRVLATWAPSNLPCMPSSYALQRSISTGLFRALTSFSSNQTLASLNYQLVPMQMGAIGPREHPLVHDPYCKEILDRMNTDHLGDDFAAYELDWMLALEIKQKFSYNHKDITCSIKCWHGMDDTIAPLGAAMWMQRETSHFLLFAVEGATHNIHLDFAIVKALFADLCAENMTREAAEIEKQKPVEIAIQETINETENPEHMLNIAEGSEEAVVDRFNSREEEIPGIEADAWK